MTEQLISTLIIRPHHLDGLRALLQQHLPHAEVWAYGSRVNDDGHDASDLDLVARQPHDLTAPTQGLATFMEACTESALPIRVEIVDWAHIPEHFQREIVRGYVVVQRERVHA